MKEIVDYFEGQARRHERSVRRLGLAVRLLTLASLACLAYLAALAMRLV